MTAVTASPTRRPRSRRVRTPVAARASRSRALLLRDLAVLRKNLKEFIPRTILQPLLLVFVFTYVFPKIGQGVGGSGAARREFSTLLVAGVVGLGDHLPGHPGGRAAAGAGVRLHPRDRGPRARAAAGVGWSRSRRSSPGALQALFAALLVFPIAAIVPATPVHLDINWPVLLTLLPLACCMSGALGLTFGTRFDPRTVPLLFGIIVLPLTFLGCDLLPVAGARGRSAWLQIARARQPARVHERGLPGRAHARSPHMSLWAVYGALIAVRRAVHLARHHRLQAPRPELSGHTREVRIVSLLPSATEIVFAVGSGRRSRRGDVRV